MQIEFEHFDSGFLKNDWRPYFSQDNPIFELSVSIFQSAQSDRRGQIQITLFGAVVAGGG